MITHRRDYSMTEPTTVTDEIAAMAKLVKILEGLDVRTRERVVGWLVERYGDDHEVAS